MFDGASEALQILLTPQTALLLVGSVALGTIVAILPGIGPASAMALLIPISIGMTPPEAMMMMTALMAAGGFAGSMTAILLNVPGDGVNAASCLDGYPMARQGRAGVAIGASATASGLGALFGLGILVLSLPVARRAILIFGPPEFFALTVAAIAMLAIVSGEALVKGLIAGLLGMALALIGVSLASGMARYTFGVDQLYDGMRIVPAVIGLFALPELFNLLRRDQSISGSGIVVSGGIGQGMLDVLRRPGLLIRSSAIGTIIGAVPGVGGGIATWLAYYMAQLASKNPRSFGKGNVEGVIAPEAAVDAKEGGSMLPVIALGLPGSISTAILLGVFTLHGVVPGRQMLEQNLPLVWVMILAMVFSNLVTSALGLAFAGQMVKLTLVPMTVLAPIIIVLGAVGSYADQASQFGILLMLGFGLLGVAMESFGYPRAPLVVGMVLLPLAETNFRVSVQMSRDSYEFLTRPLTFAIFAICLALVASPIALAQVRRRLARGRAREERLASEELAETLFGETSAERERVSATHFILPALIAFLVLVLLVETFSLRSIEALFPRIVLIPLALLLGVHLARLIGQLAQPPNSGTAAKPAEGRPAHSLAWLVAWTLLVPVLTWTFGLLLFSGIYTTAFIAGFKFRVLTPLRALSAAIGGVAMVAVIHYSFTVALGVQLDPGILGLGAFFR